MARLAELILDLDCRLAEVRDRASLAQMLVDWALFAGAEGAWVGHPNKDKILIFEAQSGKGMAEYLNAITIRVDDSPEGQGLSSRAWRSGKIQIMADSTRHEISTPLDELCARAGWRSSAAIPFCGPMGVVAMAMVVSRRTKTFSTPPWPDLLQHLSTTLGLTLQHLEDRHQLERLAHTDLLTGLANRRGLEVRLERALSAAKRQGTLLAVGLLDLDDFKLLNDRRGYDIGDKALKRLGERLRKSLRGANTVARVGGDEFVILLEDLPAPEAIESMLEQLRQVVEAPIEVAGEWIRLRASLGLALYPLTEGGETPGALLRLAYQALYQAKIRKGKWSEAEWWMLAGEVPKSGQGEGAKHSGAESISAYGAGAARHLVPLRIPLGTVSERFVEIFHAGLAREPGPTTLLDALSPEELARFKAKQGEHLDFITDPDLDESTHREAARRLGRIHATVGVDRRWLIQSYELWLESLQEVFARRPLRLRLAQPVLARRLAREIEFELEGYAEVERSLDQVRGVIENLAWHTERYTDLIEGVVLALIELDQVAAATIARPNTEGVLQYEAIAGEPFQRYLERLEAGKTLPIRIDSEHSEGRGLSGEAWRSGEIQSTLNFATDPRVAPWREVALDIGIRSSAVVPLRIGSVSGALLMIYSPYPGGYGSSQQTLLKYLQQVLSLGLERLRRTPRVEAMPERRRYRRLLTAGGLEMFYQPVVDLKRGTLAKVEALARLREDETWFTPDQFLPAFGHKDLYTLYRLGLTQALKTLDTWREAGLVTNMSLNMSPRGLNEPRYIEATRQALTLHPLPTGHHLTVEILETEALQQSASTASMLTPWRKLGVQFAQDDLGSGYSSLVRLRQIPFDEVKIDQGLVRNAATDPLRVLGFIARMIDLAREAGARVVIEGLESLGLIEAAEILGADLGQGYAITRPLSATDLPVWAKTHLPLALDLTRPHTALGVLAELIRWNQRLAAVAAWPQIICQLAAQPCAEVYYLHLQRLDASPLDTAHKAMHAKIAKNGNLLNTAYQRLYKRHLTLLVAQVTAEENRAG